MRPLDVIIPHLNYEECYIGANSLFRNTPEGVINKLIFIDQSESSYHLKEVKWRKEDIYIQSKNLGFAKAMNTGLRLSDAPYVMCLNDDVVFLNKRWWQGILDTFASAPTALCVNPASVCDPDGRGGKVIMEGFEYKEDYDDAEYDRLLKAKGTGWIDGICMWGPVFKRDMLDRVPGVIPGKAWFDERFFPGGGEDYDLNRRGFLAGMRSLGTNHSVVWHHWYGTKNASGVATVKHDGGTFADKWRGTDGQDPDVYGHVGKKEIPLNIIREEM